MLMVGCGGTTEHEQSVWNDMESASVVPDNTVCMTADGNSVAIKTPNKEVKLITDKETVRKLCADFSGEYVSDDKIVEEINKTGDFEEEYVVYFGDDLTEEKLQNPGAFTAFGVMGDYASVGDSTKYKMYFKKINVGIKSLL